MNHDVLDEVVQRFRFDAEILLQANLAQAKIHKRAEGCLFVADLDGFLDPRDLDRGLPGRLTKECGALGLDDPTAGVCEDLPDLIGIAVGVRGARLNFYQVFPLDLNRWECDFADLLDNDVTGTVLWWHQSPSRNPWVVRVPVPGQPQFYPGFLVGIAVVQSKTMS